MAPALRRSAAARAACLVCLIAAQAYAGGGDSEGHRHLAAPGSYRRLQQAAAGARGAPPAGNSSATAQWLAAARAASGAPGSHAPAWASSVNASASAAAGAAPLPAPRHVPAPSPAAGAAAPPRAPGAFISCAPDVRNYAVPTAWAPSAAAPALTYTGTTIPDRNDECADVPDPPAPAAGHTRPPVSGKALSGLPPAVAAKAAQPGLPLGVFYDAAGQRWALGGGLAPRLLPPRNARAHVPAAPAAAPGAGAAAEAAGAPGMARGLVLATALGACVGAAALLAAALLALGWRRLRCCGARGGAEGKVESERAGQAHSPFWRGARVADESRHAGAAAPGVKPRDVELGAAAAAQGHHRSPGAQPVVAAAPARTTEA